MLKEIKNPTSKNEVVEKSTLKAKCSSLSSRDYLRRCPNWVLRLNYYNIGGLKCQVRLYAKKEANWLLFY